MANPSDSERKSLNQDLRAIKSIMEEVQKAKRAGLPTADDLLTKCQECIQAIEAYKKEYFPNKP